MTEEAQAWEQAAELCLRRAPRWRDLGLLLDHAGSLPVADEVSSQVQAIREQRALLGEPDPVPPLCDRLTQGLRGALQEAHQAYAQTHAGQMERLAGSDVWQKLPDEDRGRILRQQRLGDVPEVKVGTQQEVLTTLQQRSLSSWRDQCDALPTRFGNACIEAARRLEPKAVSMKLPPATLKTEEDVDLWWEGARTEIVEKLKKGPVIIG